jgi:hypothetical protein
MAGGTNLFIDLETAAKGSVIVGGEDTGVLPWKFKGVDDIVRKEG